jgi:hypothetical protein
VYAYILMECANCGRFLMGDLTQGLLRVKNGKRPYARKTEVAAEIFLLDDLGKFSTFCLTVESSSYKYMRICLWSDV